MTHPCLHYSVNEAWFDTSAAEDAVLLRAAAAGGPAAAPSGAAAAARAAASGRTAGGGDARWGYVVDPAAGYLLDGSFVATFAGSAATEYNATYNRGVRTAETLLDRGGAVIHRWQHRAAGSVLEKFDGAGRLRLRSEWLNNPTARDAHLIKSNPAGLRFTGLVADGAACIWDAAGKIVAANTFKHGMLVKGGAPKCVQL